MLSASFNPHSQVALNAIYEVCNNGSEQDIEKIVQAYVGSADALQKIYEATTSRLHINSPTDDYKKIICVANVLTQHDPAPLAYTDLKKNILHYAVMRAKKPDFDVIIQNYAGNPQLVAALVPAAKEHGMGRITELACVFAKSDPDPNAYTAEKKDILKYLERINDNNDFKVIIRNYLENEQALADIQACIFYSSSKTFFAREIVAAAIENISTPPKSTAPSVLAESVAVNATPLKIKKPDGTT